MVYFALVNSFHHQPIIKRFSIMLDLNTSVRMLELVLWLVRVSRPWTKITYVLAVWIGSRLHTWLFDWMVVSIPEASRMAATIPLSLWSYQLGGCVHTTDRVSYVFWMVVPIPRLHVCHYQRYQLYLRLQVLHGDVPVRLWFFKTFHPSHSLRLHALGSISYTVICHWPHLSPFTMSYIR